MPDLSYSYAHAWERVFKGIDQQGPYYRVSYYFTDWSTSDAVANELRGYTQRVGGATLRVAPHSHVLSPNLMCVDVQIEPCGAPVLSSSGLPNYLGGFFAHCEYRSITYVPGGAAQDPGYQNQIDPLTPVLWATQEIDYRVERLPYGENRYTWDDGVTPTEVPVEERVGVSTLIITYHQLPYLPVSAIRSTRNKINSSTFLGAGAGKILFEGAKTFREFNTDGTITNRVTLTFQERDKDWREYLKNDGTWEKVKRPDGSYIFDTADLTPLLVF